MASCIPSPYDHPRGWATTADGYRFNDLNETIDELKKRVRELEEEVRRLEEVEERLKKLEPMPESTARHDERLKVLEKGSDRLWQLAPIVISGLALLVAFIKK